jgi:hypothetical protein
MSLHHDRPMPDAVAGGRHRLLPQGDGMGLIRRIRERLYDRRLRRLHPEFYDDAFQTRRLDLLSGLVRGKSVAVVGNAASIFDWREGQAIDAHDCVVRINRGLIKEPDSQGRRTDLLCLATLLDAATIEREFGHPRIVFVSPNRWGIAPSLGDADADFACFPFGPWGQLSALIAGRRPSAGLITVFMLRKVLGAASIDLYGFDWKATKTFYSSKLRKNHHDWDAERSLMADWAREGWLRLPSG